MEFLNCQAHFTSNPHIHQSQFAGEGIEIDKVTALVTPSVWRLRRGEANLVGVAMVL